MTTYLIIAFMVAIDVLIWLIVRAYGRRGVILALPWNIDRAKTPRWFRFNMIIGRSSFWLAVTFTIFMSILLLTEGARA